MSIKIRNINSDIDNEIFFQLSFETLISMKGLPPSMSRTQYFDLLKPMVQDYINHLENNQIFIAENEQIGYMGHVWISLKDELEPWEKYPYFWLHNITIKPEYRTMGIGTKLMEYAEQWVAKQNWEINKIGLHVNAENDHALKLYEKFHYKTFKTQLYKNVNATTDLVISEYSFKLIKTEEEFLRVREHLLTRLRERAHKTILEDSLKQKLDDYITKLRPSEDFSVFIGYNSDHEQTGYCILSESELKYQKYVCIHEFGLYKQRDTITFLKSMISFIENWAYNRQISFIETSIYSVDHELLEIIKSNGLEQFGFFMGKIL